MEPDGRFDVMEDLAFSKDFSRRSQVAPCPPNIYFSAQLATILFALSGHQRYS